MSYHNNTTTNSTDSIDFLNEHFEKLFALVAILAVSKILDAVSTVYSLTASSTTYESRVVARTLFETFGLIPGSAITVALNVAVFVTIAVLVEQFFSRATYLPGNDVAARVYPVIIYIAPIVWNTYLAYHNLTLVL